MSEYSRPRSREDFLKNFAAKKPRMSKQEAYYESSRCFFCYDAPCMTACPTGIDIPLFIKQIHTRNTVGAAQTIFHSNWLGNACGKVCPTEELCEGACVYNHADQKPIEIGRLQEFATSEQIERDVQMFRPGASNGKRVAIVGAGPAGIACACELRMLGYAVTIFEANALPSGLTVYGTAPYKITNAEALEEVRWLQGQLGFEIHYGREILPGEDLQALEAEYDALFLGVGIGGTAELGIPGEDLPHVTGAVEFVAQLRMLEHTLAVPARVVVLGGGNTAMDVASESARMGAVEVTLAYRRGRAAMGGYGFEYENILKSGVRPMFHVSPVKIVPEGVVVARTEEKDGKLSVLSGSETLIPADLVIKATGQAKCYPLLKSISGLELDPKGRICVHPVNFQTGNPKYFAGGDAVNGGAEVVNGAFEGKMAARGIHEWLIQKQ
jgi:dihydropyrimidine dehydrogenase (NAD+) subunit PreT